MGYEIKMYIIEPTSANATMEFIEDSGDCSHIQLDEPFQLERNKVYYGNNHFIHESLEVKDDVHRVFVRITMPEDHEFTCM